jgi:hypothetical protein
VSCPLRWLAASRPSCRRCACPVHCQTVHPCCKVHCDHHHLYVARKASPARQNYADRGYQGARRLLRQRVSVAPSITSVMSLDPHVGAQYPCTCPPLAIKGEARNVTTQVQTSSSRPRDTDTLRRSQALKLNTSHSGVGCYAPAARTTLNPYVFLCSSRFQLTSKTLRPLLILGLGRVHSATRPEISSPTFGAPGRGLGFRFLLVLSLSMMVQIVEHRAETSMDFLVEEEAASSMP